MTSIFLHSNYPVTNPASFKGDMVNSLGLGSKTNSEIVNLIDSIAKDAKENALEDYVASLDCALILSKEENTIIVKVSSSGTYVIIDGDINLCLNSTTTQIGKAKNDTAVVFTQSGQHPLDGVKPMSIPDITCALKNSQEQDCQNFASNLAQAEQYNTREEAKDQLPKPPAGGGSSSANASKNPPKP